MFLNIQPSEPVFVNYENDLKRRVHSASHYRVLSCHKEKYTQTELRETGFCLKKSCILYHDFRMSISA